MTFDVTAHVLLQQAFGWQNQHEVFSVCRACKCPTIFRIFLSLRGHQDNPVMSLAMSNGPNALMDVKGTLNALFDVDSYVALQDNVKITPPEHLPEEIESAFREGAACFSIACFNAAATMFRLCLDHASRPLLPDPNDKGIPQPNNRQRHQLGARLEWLFDNGRIPIELRELAECVREDGNDGAHVGSLSKEDAADVLDFTVAFLERLITEPKKIELAKDRRLERRKK